MHLSCNRAAEDNWLAGLDGRHQVWLEYNGCCEVPREGWMGQDKWAVSPLYISFCKPELECPVRQVR